MGKVKRISRLGQSNEPFCPDLMQLFSHAVRSWPESEALSYFGWRINYLKLDRMSDALAVGLAVRGLMRGDRILVQLQNIPQFIILALAAWKIGAAIVPVSPMYRTREIREVISSANPRIFVTDNVTWAMQGAECVVGTSIEATITTGYRDFGSFFPPVFDSLDNGSPHESTADLVSLIAEHDGEAAPKIRVDPHDLAVLAYTSGTTGPPKGAIMSHANLSWAGAAFVEFNGLSEPGQCALFVAPLVHITGIALHLSASLASGAKMVLGYRFDPDVYLDLIQDERVTWATGVATAYIALLQAAERLKRDVSSIRVLGCGGAAVPTELAIAVSDYFGVQLRPGYGLTESSALATSTPGGVPFRVDEESGIVSVGLPVFDSEIRILDDKGSVLPAGGRGEVSIRGRSVSRGYWMNPEATADAYRDGWFSTGDVGFLDGEGWLYIVDRIKSLIIASGYKIWPREIEDVLYRHPSVREAAVIGVPDPFRGETVMAFISCFDGERPVSAEVIAHCREALAAYKVPRDVVILEELPKNFNGKIVRSELKTLVIN